MSTRRCISIKKLSPWLNTSWKKIKNNISYVMIAVGVTAVIGFNITSQAKDNADEHYGTDFQSKIDAAIGQDPDFSANSVNPALSTSMLNINGPLQVSVDFSDIYGPTLHTKYANLLSDTNAIALQGELGTKQNRINVTLAHVFSPKNRIKITAERLAQKQTFDFYSGSIDQWVSQYAGGAELQHLIGSGFFNNISAGGYYAHSGSKVLDPVIYADDSGDNWINYRHIAGANSTGGHVSLGLKPWKTGILTVTGYYDAIHYNTQFSDVSAEDSTNIGYGVALEQYIASTLKATAAYSHRALYNTVQGGIQWFHNIRHNTAAIGASIGYSHNNYNDTTGNNSENIYTVGLQYYFMPIQNGYTMPKFDFQSLTAWASEPAVYMKKVMAAADQEKVSASLRWSATLIAASEGQTTELIQWSSDASSSVPNATINYKLTVEAVDKSQDSRVIVQDVTDVSQIDIKDLKPQVKYKAILTVTDHVSAPVSAEKTFTTTDSGNYGWDPKTAVSDVTKDSAVVTFKASERTYSNDVMTYTVNLTANDGTKHSYTKSTAVAAGNPVKITADNLEADTNYKIDIQATDDHEDTYTINNTGTTTVHTDTNGKGTIEWDDHPIQLIKDNNDYYKLSWETATLENASQYPDDKVIYAYKVVATYHDPNIYNDRPDEHITKADGTTTSTDLPSEIEIPDTGSDSQYVLVDVNATVTASDTEGNYNAETRTS